MPLDDLGNPAAQLQKMQKAIDRLQPSGDSQHPGAGANSLKIGNAADASGDESVALGDNAAVYADGPWGVSIGAYSSVEGDHATAIGAETSANHDRSTAVGHGAITGADDEVKLGDSAARVQIVGRLNVVSRTPSGSSDTQGIVNDICWDENYIYVKTLAGWKRTGLSAF